MAMSININLFEYKDRPFAEGASAYVFSPTQEPKKDYLGMLLGIGSRILENKIENGHCPNCKTKIAGKW